jgi:hypothetical protein
VNLRFNFTKTAKRHSPEVLLRRWQKSIGSGASGAMDRGNLFRKGVPIAFSRFAGINQQRATAKPAREMLYSLD